MKYNNFVTKGIFKNINNEWYVAHKYGFTNNVVEDSCYKTAHKSFIYHIFVPEDGGYNVTVNVTVNTDKNQIVFEEITKEV